jgi:hypothetical protein
MQNTTLSKRKTDVFLLSENSVIKSKIIIEYFYALFNNTIRFS